MQYIHQFEPDKNYANNLLNSCSKQGDIYKLANKSLENVCRGRTLEDNECDCTSSKGTWELCEGIQPTNQQLY